MNYTTIYIESVSISIFLLAFFFILNVKSGKPKYFGYIAAIYLLTILSALLDIFWILTDGKEQFVTLAYVGHSIYLSIFIVISAVWFCYCEKFFPFKVFKKAIWKVLFFVPAVAVLALTVTSPFSGLVFYIDDSFIYTRGDWYPLLSISWVYLIATGVISLFAAKKAQLSSDKHRFTYFFLFILSPIFLGVFSVIAPPGGLPTMQFSIAFSLLIVYLQAQSVKITSDSLTNLPNRFQLDRDIQDKINHSRREGNSPCVMIGDINYFKQINDNYGHMQGDEMLKSVAAIIDDIATSHQARAYRMGGDEFVILLDGDENMAEVINQEISAELERLSSSIHISLSMCFGYALYDDNMTLPQFLDEADKALYAKKANNQTK